MPHILTLASQVVAIYDVVTMGEWQWPALVALRGKRAAETLPGCAC